METNIMKLKIFLDERDNGIVQQNGTLGQINSNDSYINVPLTRTYKKVGDYINVDKSPFKTYVKRQNVNPYFVELSFFETIRTISNTGNTFISIVDPSESIEEKAKLYQITINKF